MSSSHDSILKKSNEIYDATSAKYGMTSSAVRWDNPQTQHFRFAELLKHLDLSAANTSVLDIGCGNAELFKYLNASGYRGAYTGFDINEALLSQARQRFPKINVRKIDIMSAAAEDRFDYVLMSGLFNVDCGQSFEWTYAFLKSMFQYANKKMVFNAISTYVNSRNEGMFYLDPSETLNFCIRNLSTRVTLCHHELPYNYSVCVNRDQEWNSI
jgi:SAM-dependent methyltransferase